MILLMGAIALAVCFATGTFRGDTAREDAHRPSDDARAIVSLWHAAKKHGVHFGQPGDTVKDVMRKVGQGAPVTDPSSPFHGKVFSSGPLSEDQLAAAAKHVQMKDGELLLVTSPAGP